MENLSSRVHAAFHFFWDCVQRWFSMGVRREWRIVLFQWKHRSRCWMNRPEDQTRRNTCIISVSSSTMTKIETFKRMGEGVAEHWETEGVGTFHAAMGRRRLLFHPPPKQECTANGMFIIFLKALLRSERNLPGAWIGQFVLQNLLSFRYWSTRWRKLRSKARPVSFDPHPELEQLDVRNQMIRHHRLRPSVSSWMKN